MERPRLLEHAFERVEDLGAGAGRFAKKFGALGHDHELLEIDGRVGVRAAVDDVHHRHRQDLGVRAAEVLVQSVTPSWVAAASRAWRGETARMALAPSFGFVRRAVDVNHGAVDRRPDRGRRSLSMAPAAASLFTLATAFVTPLPRYLLLSPRAKTSAC